LTINDLAKEWKGNIHVQISKDGTTVGEVSKPLIIPGYGQKAVSILCETPITPGKYTVIASLGKTGERPIKSTREILFK
jgi:hypothetical protein